MGVRIRLSRMGSKKRPFYRIVVADSRAPRDGRFVEVLGTYNPRTEPIEVKVDPERLHAWLTQGAEPTDTVKSLLKKKGLLAKPA
ncbi:MAG TPA: 30S ribosomal protein S16 [Syntrophobacteria bacterium]|nr:30S ribosomal protein S16 [Syntrophobacteria bacterium]